ncbi:unnamed protein product [Linum trigynum]|uniref:Uncharacterized protein n=1 Tax=Linum trigynum TaxID=586398 RepID=A0AAV2F0D4_9ROSI
MSMSSLSNFKVLAWNVGGAGGRAFARALKLVLQTHRPEFVILLEPQISGGAANAVCDSLGFPRSIRVEASGRKGGIWVLWRDNDFTPHLISACSQHISLRIDSPGNPSWVLTAIYASPRQSEQSILWKNLLNQSKQIDIAWLLTGDFNAIRDLGEKAGPPANNTVRRCKLFNDRINSAELLDLGFSGPKFTWTRGNESTTVKASRIDRSLCNPRWNLAFPNTSVLHLPRTQSDHNPILTMIQMQENSGPGSRPFRFEAAWLSDSRLQDLVSNAWDSLVPLPSALVNLAGTLQDWNVNVLGSIQQRKRRFLARIKGVEDRLAIQFSPGLAKLHAKLEAELDQVLEQEEMLWFQRARDKWVKFGERNTAYFHQQTNLRRRKKKIKALQDEADNWVNDPLSLASLVFDSISNLYLQDGSTYEDKLPTGQFPRLSQEERLTLLRPFTTVDIHKAIFDMKPFQAPGPDGFHAAFYQHMWRVVGRSLTDMALAFFETGELPPSTTDSTLVLIPKVEVPEKVTHLRPISLNNVSLKAITKAMTSRLKPVMRKLVSPRQSSFIPGRQTADNILVVQEVLHSFRKKRGKKGGLVFKIDLEKAYDRLRWDFLRDTLKEVGLPSSWINCIMYCVEQNRMRILWNGELSEPFSPSRGVRQGDPLSPYLFVLCMERLSHRIDHAVREGLWKPVKLSVNGPPLTHLFFADDLLLFAEAENRQITIIRQCLEDFCFSSGQRVNYSKSIIYVSPNIGRRKATQMSQRAGIPLKAALGKYLGIQAIQERVTKGRYQSLILRIQKRMAPWKARRLSFAARLTLTQSVSVSLPVYNMQTELIPMGVCRSIDKLNRDFIWGDEEEKTKMHLVAWEKMTKSKKQGGVGIRPTRQANLAMLAKSGWRLLHDKESIWTQVMKAKYARHRQDLDMIRPIKGSSFSWASIAKVASLLKKGCAWNIKDGKKTHFWLDCWVSQVPLRELVTEQIPLDLEGAKVADMVGEDGGWRRELFENYLPEDVVQKILSVAVDNDSEEEDRLLWSASANGNFTTKSAFHLLSRQQPDPDETTWKIIWKLPTPERVRCFMWQAFLDKLATNALRYSRRVADSPDCARCSGQPETTLHLLRDCPPAVFFWARHVPQQHHTYFFTCNLREWLRMNLTSSATAGNGVEWPAFFSTATWLIWKNRSVFCFKGAGAAMSPPTLEFSILTKTKLWSDSWRSPSPLQDNRNRPATRVMADIGWGGPESGWVTLNIDGASNGNPGPAGAGGLLRDGTGKWLKGFVANLGIATAALAELWAFNHGMELAWKEGHRAIKIESDSQLAIHLIENRHDPIHPYATLLAGIRRMISRDWLVRIVHTYREGNRAADWLSKHSLVYPNGVYELTEPPDGLRQVLRDDMLGVTSQRRIVIPSTPLPP